MPNQLSTPTCLECGKEMTSRRNEFCDLCMRQGLPTMRAIGPITKGIVLTAARNAVNYWSKQIADARTPAIREHAEGQLEYFKQQIVELEGGAK